MFHLTFSLSDIPKVLIVIFLECALSADNAFILASLVQPLSTEKERTKALWIGSFSSLILRAIAILLLAYLIQYRWTQVIGAFYLIYLSIAYYFKKKGIPEEITCLSKKNFWLTVVKIEILDCLFAVDSILAALAVVGISSVAAAVHTKIWIVYLGGIIGVVAIRFAAKLFSLLMKIFPKIQGGTHIILGWIGLKMLTSTIFSYVIHDLASLKHYSHITEIVFWVGMVSIFSLTFLPYRKSSL